MEFPMTAPGSYYAYDFCEINARLIVKSDLAVPFAVRS